MKLCFQETKLDCTNSSVLKSLWSSPFVDWGSFGCHSHGRGCSPDLGQKGV